jgi:AraC family transcriptional regulator, positive regulator of tynA and feaB
MRVQAWDTAALGDAEQFTYWREVVWEAFCPVVLTRPGEGGFSGAVKASAMGPLGVSTISSQAQVVSRTETEVRRAAGDVFFLNMPLRGGSTVTQGGRVARLAPGDFAVVDGSRPFELRFEDDFDQVSLTVPHDMLAPLLPDPEAMTARTVRGDSGLGATAGGALRGLAQGGATIDREISRPVADRIVGLVALSLGSAKAARSGAEVLIQLALEEVERSLADPALSPTLVAGRIGVSTRHLHQLFSARGPSFSRHVLARRLERCRQDLRDPELAALTIGEIGWRNGFLDPSYLARAFRRAYGVTPGEFRRDVRSRAGNPARSS